MITCLQQGVNNLHMLQLMPLLPPIISCFTEIQTRLTFLVLAYPPGGKSCPGRGP